MAVLSLPGAAESPRLERLADGMAAAVAASLPWSTSATGILLLLWLLSLLPVRDFGAVWRVMRTPAGGLPVALLAFALIGTVWAEVSLAERQEGAEHFLKLLAIPILMAQFRRSPRVHWVLNALLASAALMLALSLLHAAWPDMPLVDSRYPGVPIKDHLSQSGFFTFAAFVFLAMAASAWKEGRFAYGAAFGLLAATFLAHMLTIATARTALVVLPVLLVLFCWRLASWKIAAVLLIGVTLTAGGAWNSLPYLRDRVESVFDQLQRYETQDESTSAGVRLEFWKNAVPIVSEAPIVGHGTGSIRESYQRVMDQGYSRLHTATTNPHNQTLAVALQLGLVGVVLLCAMWIAHLALFYPAASLLAWAGMVVVVQNMVASLFNSHLQDFTNGWFYAVMVGVLGGAMLRERDAGSARPPDADPPRSR